MSLLSTLPEENVVGDQHSPQTIIIYGNFKIGKSAIAAWITRNHKALWLDYESGGNCLTGKRVDVIKAVAEINKTAKRGQSMSRVQYIRELCEELGSEDVPRYDFIIHDKLDNLESWAEAWATNAYKNGPIGKNFDGDSVLELPKGSGYLYLREKFKTIWNSALGGAKYNIFFASMRDKYLEKDSKEVEIQDLALTGKVRHIAAGFADAIGYLYRGSDGVNHLSFLNSDGKTFAGNRVKRLDGKRIPFSWIDKESGELQVDFTSVYKDI